MNHKKIVNIILLVICLNFVQQNLAQEIRVIDHKGTKNTVKNNKVTTAAIAPSLPLENDVWFDTSTTPTIIKIYNGSNWINFSPSGTQGSIFFASTAGIFTENNSQLFWDNISNRLGVGTDSPSHKFHVTGAMRSEGILNSNGTVGRPSYRFSDDTDTGMYSPFQDEISFSVGGFEALNIDVAANKTTVIINETLKLNGSIVDETGSAGTIGQLLSATATGTSWVNISSIETLTALTQNLVTGEITYTNENSVQEKAKVVSANPDNSIKIGTDGGAYKALRVFDGYDNTGGQTIGNSISKLNINTTRTTLGGFTLSSNNITIPENGIYEITYHVTFNNTNSLRAGVRSELRTNNIKIAASDIYTYPGSTSGDISSGAKTLIINLAQSDLISIHCQKFVTNGTVVTIAEGISISLKKLN